MSNHRYNHVQSFKDLDNEIERKQLELSLIGKHMEVMAFELKYQLAPKKLLNYAVKKGLGYLFKLF
jgi:hypothetical protein